MESIQQDIICSTLLEVIRKLKIEFQKEPIENILEIKSNLQSIANYNQLLRIERAADQYRKRTNNLFYIGFLGHFSSGKSSTINTLLGLSGTMDEKRTGQNPTDDQITLITSSDNNQDVIKLIRSGQIPVIISLIEGHNFIKDKVIMDTPGSGDPSTFEEIVRDSLPLCDLIIYCMAATHPLTNSDIPLLREKEKQLYNIPTIYLITRGNEFKIDNLKRLIDDNFNRTKYQKFASELAARIKQVVDSINLTYEDFIVIDNKESFNLQHLEDQINSYCSPENYGNILRLHDHKMDYFSRSIKEIKAYFINLITSKLEIIEKYFAQAKAKIDEYEQTSIIGTDKMVNSWRPIDEKIKQVLDGSVSQNNIIHKSLDTPDEFPQLPTNKDWHKKNLEIKSIHIKAKITSYQTQLKASLFDLKEKITAKIFMLLSENKSIDSALVFDEIQLEIEKCYFIYDIEHDIANSFKETNKITFDYFDLIKYPELKRQIESFKNRTKNSNPLESILKSITESKSVLAEIFGTYKSGVRIYTVAAFSIEAKSYIKNLGLSDKLDLIDVAEPDINPYLMQTEKDIFDTFYSAVKDFELKCDQLYTKANAINYNNPILTAEVNAIELTNEGSAILESYNLKLSALNQDLNNKIKNYFSSKIQSAHSSFLTLIIQRDAEIKALTKLRIVYYLKMFLPTLSILGLTVILFYLPPRFNFSNNLSIGNQWLLGILVNLTSVALNTIISIRKDKHEIIKKEIEKRFIENEKESIAKVINHNFDEFISDLCSHQTRYVNQLLLTEASEILKILQSIKFNSNNNSLHSILVTNERILKELLTEYSKALNEFKNTCNRVLNNTSFNKEVLYKQSKLIKEYSINPSFRLLEETRNNILNVKSSIEYIDFV